MKRRNYGFTRKERRLADTFENPVRKSETRHTGLNAVVNVDQFGFIEGIEDARPTGEGKRR